MRNTNLHNLFVGYIVFPFVAFMLLYNFVAMFQSPTAQALSFNPDLEDRDIELPVAELDLQKLSVAVSCAETSCGKDGTARKRNNLHGLMAWDANGNRYVQTFKTPADSHEAFKKLWARSYKKFPNLRLATTWVCGGKWPTGKPCGHNGVDNPNTWLYNVKSVYAKL